MNGMKLVKGAAIVLATLGMVLPGPVFAADGKAPGKDSIKIAKKGQIPDISLAAGGMFAGRVVDHNGNPLEGAEVVIKQNKKELARVVTDEKGVFSHPEMKGGIYQVSSGNTDGVFRLWTEKTAPPAAKGHALLVMGENGARGQFGGADPTLVLLALVTLATLVVAVISLDEIQDIKDCCKDCQSP